MEEDNSDEIALEIEKIRTMGRKTTRRIRLMAFLFISIGIALAYVFRNADTEAQYIALVSLISQVIAFTAALMLSEQFLKIPEKFGGIHNYAIAAAMSAPIYIWLGSFFYTFPAILFGAGYSELWSEAITIACWGLGIVIYGFGSLQEALSLEIKDKSAVVGWGWYMVVFCLGLQMYISLIELEIITRTPA